MSNNKQVGGTHYIELPKQPWDLIDEINANYYVGNVIKYVSRYKSWCGAKDLRKALHYLEHISQKHTYQPLVEGAAQKIGQYCQANNMSRLENSILWFTVSSQIYLAQCRLEELIEKIEKGEPHEG